MNYNSLENLSYCFQFFLDDQGLLLYTHIPPIIIALIFAAFVMLRAPGLPSRLLAVIAIIFSVYSTIDLLQWVLVGSSAFIMASWSILGLLTVLMFFFTHAFVHAFLTSEWMPRWMIVIWGVALAPIIFLTPTAHNISAYYLRDCIAIENVAFTNYYYGLGLLAIVLMYISVRTARKLSPVASSLVFIGTTLFISTFMVTGVLATFLVDAGYIPDFGMTQYGIAAMSVFIGFMAYVTAYYQGFNIKILSAQVLVVALALLIAAQLFFVRSTVNQILVALTLLTASLFGIMLVRSVQREVALRTQVEHQEKELEAANKEQESLLHFISHEVKGFLSDGQNAFAAIVEGDFGEPPPRIRTLSQTALAKMRTGVTTVIDILDAANFKKGSMTFTKAPFDLGAVVERVVAAARERAAAKGVTITFEAPHGEQVMTGDVAKIERHVVRNILDNSIRYTPSGSISVLLQRTNTALRLEVVDTGVGITPEDMRLLFTEGGHGRESIKVNVDSTGFGLFVAKKVVDAHGGRIWAESEGKGAGSRFIVEWPLSASATS